jgi:hypothetical protein
MTTTVPQLDDEVFILAKNPRIEIQRCGGLLDAKSLRLELVLEDVEQRQRRLDLILLSEHAETLAATLMAGLARLHKKAAYDADVAGEELEADDERTH